MHKKTYLAALCVVLSAFSAGAQVTQADPVNDFRGRVSAGVDYKIAKGLHLSLDEEARFSASSGGFSKLYSTLGLDYKFCKYAKADVSGTYILNPSGANKARVAVGLTGMYKVGQWSFSLKEQVRLTHRFGDMNEFQAPRNAVDLKSRVKVAYKCQTLPLKPYVLCEFKNCLNAVDYQSLGTSKSTAGTVEYTDAYLNRIRGGIGVEWRISKKNTLDFYGLYDYVKDRDVDASKAGKYKSVTIQPANYFTLGIAYKFSL